MILESLGFAERTEEMRVGNAESAAEVDNPQGTAVALAHYRGQDGKVSCSTKTSTGSVS